MSIEYSEHNTSIDGLVDISAGKIIKLRLAILCNHISAFSAYYVDDQPAYLLQTRRAA
jgi:hypothetical protein